MDSVTDEGTVLFDDSAWPLLIVICPVRFAKDSVGTLVDGFERIHARAERFASIIDARATLSMPDPAWRKKLLAWVNDPRVRTNTQQLNIGSAMIMSSVLVRGTYTALTWMWKPASPQAAFATFEEGIRWCYDELTRARVPKSARLIELRRALSERPPASRSG
jgi:hypothetical protein